MKKQILTSRKNKYDLLIFIFALSFFFQGCGSSPIPLKFLDKEFVIKDSDPQKKITLQVPNSCEKFDKGIKTNFDVILKYADKEAEFKANYDKILLIEEFSDRLKAITTAQCNIVKNALVIDTNNSDQSFYDNIVKDYTEYQKVKDLINSSPTESQKGEIIKTILSVYENIYDNKRDELVEYVKNLNIQLDVTPYSLVFVYINNKEISRFRVGEKSPYVYTLDKKYLLPIPGEEIKVRFKVGSIDYSPNRLEFSLSQLRKKEREQSVLKLSNTKSF